MLESCLDARIALDFHPPQGAHTRYLRTLSKNLSSAGASPPPQLATFRRQRAAHHTTIFLTVNTPRCPFPLASPTPEPRTLKGRAHDFRLAGRRGARILTVVALQGKRKSTNRSKNSFRAGKLTGCKPGTRAETRRSLIGCRFYRSRHIQGSACPGFRADPLASPPCPRPDSPSSKSGTSRRACSHGRPQR